MRFLWPLLLLLVPFASAAEEVVLGLSKDKVAITTSFDGSEILIFGAVKRETPIPEGSPLEVVITITGPSEPVIVRRKSKLFAIWVNTDSVEVDRAPSFYAVATTAPLADVLSETEDLRHKVTIDRAIRSVGAPDNIENAALFTDAVIRIRRDADLYQTLENGIALDQQTLFRTAIEMPSNLTEGNYATRIFLTRDGKVVSSYETSIAVQKVGLERWLFTLSREQPFWYGILSLAIAIAAGWGASAAFRLLRS
ncbi:TIGR02186 family protein [Sedimentitalea sp.]|uniref:TIGR02186 family protein n=1 Tax=Sedimentitalea sp. TaxID=2048915 RepID=UPI003298FDCC